MIRQLVNIEFQHLVVSLGAEIDLSRVPGMPEHALLMQNVGDAMILRATIISRLEEANVESREAVRKRLLTFVIARGFVACGRGGCGERDGAGIVVCNGHGMVTGPANDGTGAAGAGDLQVNGLVCLQDRIIGDGDTHQLCVAVAGAGRKDHGDGAGECCVICA